MRLFWNIVIGIVVLNVAWLVAMAIAQVKYSVARRKAMSMEVHPSQQEITTPLYLTADYYITVSDDHTHAIVVGTDEKGTVVSETPLGEADTLAEVLALAKAKGWKVADGADPANDIYIEIVPAPLRVRIVGYGPLDEAKAIAIAENAGLTDIIGVISQEVDEAESSLVIEFAVSKPKGWVDSEIQQWKL